MKFIIVVSMLVMMVTQCSIAQTDIDTIGNTIVEIDIVVDSTHFITGGQSSPWDLYWGPDQKLWFTNARHLCRYDPLTLIVDTILSIPSGYMMGVTADRNFPNQAFVYLCIDTAHYYAQGTIINVFRYEYNLTGDSLFNAQLFLNWSHFWERTGGRIIHGQDDKLYISTGEYSIFNDTLFSNSGKVLRVNTDGSVPSDNPRLDYTYSYGHRNPQGIVQAPNGNIFVSEYGEITDELNLILRDRFYGWEVFDDDVCMLNIATCNYYDTIAMYAINPGINPPSGIDVYNHSAIPEFNGLIQAVTGVIKQGIIAYTMNVAYDSVIQKNYYLTGKYGRIRDVCSAPDGSVYFISGDRATPQIRVLKNPLYSGLIIAQDEKLFSFYPNPVMHNLFLNFRSEAPTDILLFDISGKLIFKNQFTGKSGTINVEAIPEGFYLISAQSKNERTGYRKLIIIK